MPVVKCKVCQKEFERNPGSRAAYCSPECRSVHKKNYSVAYYKEVGRDKFRQRYVPAKPRDIVCKSCGTVFQGMYRQKYCKACLSKDDKYMRQLSAFRKGEK